MRRRPRRLALAASAIRCNLGLFFKKTKRELFSKRRYRAPPSCWTRFQKPPPKLATTLAKSHHARYGHANKNNKYSSSVFPKFLSLKTKVSRNAVVVAVLAVLAFLNVSFTNRNTTTRTRHWGTWRVLTPIQPRNPQINSRSDIPDTEKPRFPAIFRFTNTLFYCLFTVYKLFCLFF